MNRITIIDYLPEHQPAFERLNRNWIEKLFHMEERDVFTLTNPEEAILHPGGAILMALYDGEMAGTVALRKESDSTFEFTKMAVDERFRRRGIAEALTQASFEKATALGAERIVLYSHSSLEGAIALYLKMGFYHLLMQKGVYRRSDVKMEYWINKEKQVAGPANIQIIHADESHAPVIAGVGRTSFTDAFGPLFISKEELKNYLDHTYAISKVAAGLRKESNAFYVAVDGERPVGFVKLKRNSLNTQIDSLAQMELQKIYVLKEYHGSGAAAGLMNAAVQLAKEDRAEHLWLDTYIGNDRGIRFYEKNGFKIAGKHHFTIGTQTFEYHLMDLLVIKEDNHSSYKKQKPLMMY
jgi:ribosomal protein S18 acetylase RimI-like enzyme